jgi:hypothetical protein
MSASTTLALQAGEPYAATITVTDGKLIWATLDLFEVRSHARRYASETSDIIADLTPHLSSTYSGNDIVITLTLTGAFTRALEQRSAHYDMFISDTGTTDTRAFRLLYGPLTVSPAVTSAA